MGGCGIPIAPLRSLLKEYAREEQQSSSLLPYRNANFFQDERQTTNASAANALTLSTLEYTNNQQGKITKTFLNN